MAVGNTTAVNIIGGAPSNSPTGFWIYDTRSPGSQPRQGTINDARLVYNDFGLLNLFGIPWSGAGLDADSFLRFRTPYGDVGRNTFSGLPHYQVNMAIFKMFKTSENTKLEFRAEASNLLNRRNFGVPDPITEDVYFSGAVGSFQNPGFNNGSQRELRLGLRFIF